MGVRPDHQDPFPHGGRGGKSLKDFERALRGDATCVSVNWIISRVCEEFGCTPDIAVELPFGITARIMSLRDYANARSIVESAEDPSKVKMTPTIARVLQNQAELELGIGEEA